MPAISNIKTLFLLAALIMGAAFGASLSAEEAAASAHTPVRFGIEVNGGDDPTDVGVAIQILFAMTLLTLAPSIIMLMTSFTRIVIVLSFVGRAVGTQGMPNSKIIATMALFLTFFVMGPVWNDIYGQAVNPYMEEELSAKEALKIASGHMSEFMLKQTSEKDLEFFLGLSGMGPTKVEDLPMRIIAPSFVLSELRTAFQMGFLIFVPFIVVDFLVASTLMSMGMMMMPPAIISMPFKLLLFVLVDGWALVVRSLVESFN